MGRILRAFASPFTSTYQNFKEGNIVIGNLWKSITNPVCPQCTQSVLVMMQTEDRTLDQKPDGTVSELYPWVCAKCGYTLMGSRKLSDVRAAALNLRNDNARAQFSGMALAEREKIARGHRIHSRVMFLFSLCTLMGCVYWIISGASLLIALNWLVFAVMLWVFGMKRSYRAWQVLTGSLFVEGAFLFWFKYEKWLV